MEDLLKDKTWRLSHLYMILDKNQKLVPFKMNRAQTIFHNTKTSRSIILKSRQLGFTTYEAIDALDDTLFTSNTQALMLSYDEKSMLSIFDNKINLAWNNIPPEIQSLYSLDSDRANRLKFNWGNGSFSSIEVRTKGRSGTYSRLHISEFAKICKGSPSAAREIIGGTLPSVPSSGKICIESTPEDANGYFYNMFMDAYLRGDPITPVDYKAFFFNWTYDDAEMENLIPIEDVSLPKKFVEYKNKHHLTQKQITYYYHKWLSLAKDDRELKRQYPTTVEEAFEYSGDKLFDPEKLLLMQIREPKDSYNGWKYYADYRPGHRYGLGADPSGGGGNDNATIAIIDFDAKDMSGHLRPEVVATYVNDRIAPDLFAHEIKSGGTKYGNCLVAPESNNHGHATITKLKDIYYNIFKEVKKDKQIDVKTENLGWRTDRATKPKMIFDLNTAVNEQLINIPDPDTIREMQGYPRDDLDNYQKDDGEKHFDRVIAVAIAWQMKNYATGGEVKITSGDESFDKFNPIAEFL
jgi:hypothetical protein